MKIKRAIRLLTATLLSLSSLFVLAPVVVHAVANTLYWCNTAGGNFSTATNWDTNSNCSGHATNSIVPVAGNGDTLIFDNTSLTADTAVTNNIASLTVANITFQGSASYVYTITNATGDTLLPTSTITANSSNAIMDMDINATSGFNVTGTGYLQFGTATSTHTFTVSAPLTLNNTSMYDKLSGNNSITVINSFFYSDDTGYTGVITTSGSGSIYINNKNSLGGATWVINNFAQLNIVVCDGDTVTGNIKLSNASITTTSAKLIVGVSNCTSSGGGGAGGGGGSSYDEVYSASNVPTSGSVTLAGTLNLASDETIQSSVQTTTITSALSGAFHLTPLVGSGGTITINSSNNTSATSNGTYAPKPQTQTLTDSSTATVDIAGNFWLYIDGQRGDTTVDRDAYLLGSGKVGKLTVNSGGTVAPGHSPGCLTVSGGLVLSGTYQAELGGTTPCSGYDQLQVTGTVTLSGTLDVIPYGTFKPSLGQKFTIISNDGTDAVIGTFANQPEGSTVKSNGYAYTISYKGGDGNDVVITVIGTPNTGFASLTHSPALAALVTLPGALGIAVVSRRFNRQTKRR